jgi:hypothetical protein
MGRGCQLQRISQLSVGLGKGVFSKSGNMMLCKDRDSPATTAGECHMKSEDSLHLPAGKHQRSPSSSEANTPTIQWPKGGGAIRGIGEKFAANPVTGTGSMSIPIVTSPGRSGFGPQLSLSYDSGAGNGPFGFGWSLSLPSITRKTDKGLPQYFDAVDSDVFILSGAEDLVPFYRQDADGTWVAGHPGYQRDPPEFWVRDPSGRLVIREDEIDGNHVRRYRPRIEGLFARIERWNKIGSSSDVHWRSISKDNILTLYGFDVDSRIADPLDANRIFTWLICETRDNKGNAVLYRYKAEDGQKVDLSQHALRALCCCAHVHCRWYAGFAFEASSWPGRMAGVRSAFQRRAQIVLHQPPARRPRLAGRW